MAKALATKKVGGEREGSFPRGGGRLGWGRLARATELPPIVNRAFQRQKDLFGFIDDGLRTEPNDVEATGLENSCSPRVLARLVSMDGAIDFDDEFERRAVEVDDESSDDVLTSKLEARELAFSYSAPELGLGWRGVASHLPGMFEFRSGSRPRP